MTDEITPEEALPDARDGLCRIDRIVLYVLNQTQTERKGRSVPTVMLYGRVLEHVNISEEELHASLYRLGVQRR
ncbi:MAG: hypothetical protein EA349_05635 [Halomonadaceae bacterium]|nr:MAG: hypothetical protein EA349_05635 [Halomonadaceae bacterium]